MTKQQVRQQLKNECLGRIMHIFSPYWKSECFSKTIKEEQGEQVRDLIEKLKHDLKELENKYK